MRNNSYLCNTYIVCLYRFYAETIQNSEQSGVNYVLREMFMIQNETTFLVLSLNRRRNKKCSTKSLTKLLMKSRDKLEV